MEDLKKLQRIDCNIRARLEQIDNLDELTKIIGMLSNTASKQTNTKIINLKTKINKEIDELIIFKQKVADNISKIDNEEYKLLLTLRYIRFKTWEQIADEMDKTFQWIHILHKRALNYYKKVDNVII